MISKVIIFSIFQNKLKKPDLDRPGLLFAAFYSGIDGYIKS
jgi:hypothetical protein